jgi:glycosyltransferase involved in cell wall biosynthesis
MDSSRDVRVCYAAYGAFDPQKGGGSRRYARYLPGLRERGISPEIVSGTQKASKLEPQDLASEWARLSIGAPLPATLLNGTRVRGVRLPDQLGRERAGVYFRALLAHCRDPESRPDVVNLLMTFSAASLRWVRELRRLGIPLVYSLTIVPKLPKNSLKRFFKVQMFRRHYRLMDAVNVSCLYQERWLREIGVDKPIAVIPNGVDFARFRPPRDESERGALRYKLGFAANDEVLTTIGAVSPRKGTDLAIEALRPILARRPHARLVILGLRSDQINPRFASFRRRLEGLLADPWLAARVRFMGNVDNPHEYLRASDVYVFASHRESIPNSMFEAMASGLPTVIAPFLGWGEDCGEAGRDYLLAKHDPESLASAVTTILEDPALRAALAKSGHAWTQEFMKSDIPLDRLAALYQQLMRSPAQV